MLEAEALYGYVFICKGCNCSLQIRLDTVLVFKVKFADNIVDKLLLYWVNNEKSKWLGSGGRIITRLTLKGIDGKTPQGVEPAA